MDDYKSIIKHLIATQGYSEREADIAARGLLDSNPLIQQAYITWRQTQVLPELNAEGITGQILMERYGLLPVAALLTLDWLMVDPVAAKRAIVQGMDQVK